MLLKMDPRFSTNELHTRLKILKVADIYKVNILHFVNNCNIGNCPDSFKNYFTARESNYNIRCLGLQVKSSKTNIGAAAVNIYGAKLWNGLNAEIKNHKYKKCFKKHLVNHFLAYNN